MIISFSKMAFIDNHHKLSSFIELPLR